MKHVVRAGARIAFIDDGPEDAPPLVLIHALGCDHSLWDAQMACLARSFRIVRVDVRGHGASDAPSGDYTLDELAEDVLAIADAVEADRAHVAGASLGGMIALWLAIHRPSRVRSLVVANTAARIGTRERWDARLASVREEGMAAVWRAVLVRFFSAETRARRPDLVARAGAIFERTDPIGYAGCCAAIRDADLRDDVRSIRAPLLVITGALDDATPPEQGAWIAEHARDAVCLEIAGAGHLACLEQPEAFAGAVASFLAERPA